MPGLFGTLNFRNTTGQGNPFHLPPPQGGWGSVNPTTGQGNPYHIPAPPGGWGTPAQTPPPGAVPPSSAPAPGTSAWYQKLLGKSQNVALPYLFNDVTSAINGPDLYSSNDIRNAGLATKAAAGQSWRDFLQGANTDAAMSGMQDSGFYGDALARKSAANDANLNAQVVAGANQMSQANTQFRQQKMADAMNLLSMFLNNKRQGRLAALQLANPYGRAGP